MIIPIKEHSLIHKSFYFILFIVYNFCSYFLITVNPFGKHLCSLCSVQSGPTM